MTPSTSASAGGLMQVSATAARPLQRKIHINGVARVAKEQDSDAVKQAVQDGYLRTYESEKEVRDHLVEHKPVSVGLIEKRALWYRIPWLADQKRFFVFGEHHNAVTGSDIQQASNIKEPILDEAQRGEFSRGVLQHVDEGARGVKGARVALDESGSKLLRTIELALTDPIAAFLPSARGPASSIDPPGIPPGALTAREEKEGTYRLAVLGPDAKPGWWQQPGIAASASGAIPTAYIPPVAEAILSLLPQFLQTYGDAYTVGITKEAFEYLTRKQWKPNRFSGDPVHRKTQIRGIEKALKGHLSLLQTVLKAQVHADYEAFGKDRQDDHRSLGAKPEADDYRNEYMLAAVRRAEATKSYAFATMGASHLQAIKPRLGSVPSLTTKDLFSSPHGTLAIAPPDPLGTWLRSNPPALAAPHTNPRSAYARLQSHLRAYESLEASARFDANAALLRRATRVLSEHLASWTNDTRRRERIPQIEELIGFLEKGEALRGLRAT